MIILVLSSSILFFVIIYPYIVYPAILKMIGEKDIARSSVHRSITLLFCAYNEEDSILEKIENLRALKSEYPELEVLAFDDGSSDRTYQMLSAVPELLSVVRGGGRNGKAFGMKKMARRAKGDVLLFTDANVLVAAGSLDRLRSYFADPQIGGVCGKLLYMGSNNSPTAEIGSLYWRLEEKIKSLESRCGNVMGADGSIFAVRSELYPDFPDTVLDDFTVSMEVVFRNKRLVSANDVIGHERLVTDRKDEFARKIRISARAFHTHLVLRKKLSQMGSLDKFKYISHKVLRWWGGSLLFAFAVTATAAIWIISPVIAVSFALFGLLILLIGTISNLSPVSMIAEITLALFATQLGVIKALRGQTFSTWNPPTSRQNK